MGTIGTVLITIVATIVLIAILIIPHELGHLAAARIFGVRPTLFTLGMGKTLWKKEVKGTTYALKLLPIGGAIVIDDEDEAFKRLGLVKRSIIIAAGAFMNFLTAVIIVVVIALFFTPDIPTMQIAEISKEATESGYMQGIEKEDTVLKIDNKSFATVYDMNVYLALDGKEKFNFLVDRNGDEIFIEDVSLPMKDIEGVVGADIFEVCYFYGEPSSFGASMSYSVRYMRSLFSMTFASLKALVTGKVPVSAMSSVVGIGALVSETIANSEQVAITILSILALVSISLTVVNLLPIPALDGGHILIMVIEKIIRRPVNQKALKIVNRIFLVGLMVLSVALILLDVFKMFKKG